jgi:DNA-binding SARP family transcriptional activator
MIGRRGDGYVLELTNEQADVLQFAETLRGAQAARARGDLAAAALAWQVALEIYRGDLLAAEGTADWLVEERELFRTRAAEAAEELAAHRLETGDAAGALRAAGRGLEIDRYRDGLWRALVAAHEQAGELAAAARATADYGRVLEDLGVRPAATAPATASL